MAIDAMKILGSLLNSGALSKGSGSNILGSGLWALGSGLWALGSGLWALCSARYWGAAVSREAVPAVESAICSVACWVVAVLPHPPQAVWPIFMVACWEAAEVVAARPVVWVTSSVLP